MDNKFRKQMLAESKKKEEELEDVNLEIEKREVSENGPFVLICNKKNTEFAVRHMDSLPSCDTPTTI